MTREAKAAWARNRRRQIAYGRWNPTQQLDPQPVRDHINNLRRFGLSVHTIGKLAGEARGALSQIIYPNHSDYLTWITPERAARILAVKFDLDAIPDGRNVDAADTRRRLEALMTLGWSQGHIADALGVSRQRVSTYRRSAHTGVSGRESHHAPPQPADRADPTTYQPRRHTRESRRPGDTMKLTLKLTDEIRDFSLYGPDRTRAETLVEIEDVQFTRSLMGSFFRALADEIDPLVREAQFVEVQP